MPQDTNYYAKRMIQQVSDKSEPRKCFQAVTFIKITIHKK